MGGFRGSVQDDGLEALFSSPSQDDGLEALFSNPVQDDGLDSLFGSPPARDTLPLSKPDPVVAGPEKSYFEAPIESLFGGVSALLRGATDQITSGNFDMLGGAVEAIGRVKGSDWAQRVGKDIQEWAESNRSEAPMTRDQVNDLRSFMEYGGYGVGSAMGTIAPMIGSALIPYVGGPAAVTLGTAMSMGEAYKQLVGEGVDPDLAAKTALPLGAAMGVLDRVGVGRIIGSSLKRKIQERAIESITKQMARSGLESLRDEAVTEAAQSALLESTAAVLTGNTDLKERTLNVLEEGAFGGIGGGITGGAMRGAHSALSRKEKIQQAGDVAAADALETPDSSPDFERLVGEGEQIINESAGGSAQSNVELDKRGIPKIGEKALHHWGDESREVTIRGYEPASVHDGVKLPARVFYETADGIEHSARMPMNEIESLEPVRSIEVDIEAEEAATDMDLFRDKVEELGAKLPDETIQRNLERIKAQLIEDIKPEQRPLFEKWLQNEYDLMEAKRQESEQARVEREQNLDDETLARDEQIVFDREVEDLRVRYKRLNEEEVSSLESQVRQDMELGADDAVPANRRKSYSKLLKLRLDRKNTEKSIEELGEPTPTQKDVVEEKPDAQGNLQADTITIKPDQISNVEDLKKAWVDIPQEKFSEIESSVRKELNLEPGESTKKFLDTMRTRLNQEQTRISKQKQLDAPAPKVKKKPARKRKPKEPVDYMPDLPGMPAPTPEVAPESGAPVPVQQGKPEGGEYRMDMRSGDKSHTVRDEIVEADTLIPSNKLEGGEVGGPNPKYHGWLQPRWLLDAAERAKIGGIARNLKPHWLGSGFMFPDEGSPVVAGDNIVESGNGRVLAIMMAYQGGKGEQYRKFLKDQGYDVEGMKQPVLIRRRTNTLSNDERRSFTSEAQFPASATLGPTGQGISDAQLLGPEIYSRYEGGKITSRKNVPFVRKYLELLPPTQLNDVITSRKRLTAMGKVRLETALLAKALDTGNPQGIRDLVETVATSEDDFRRAIQAGVIQTAPAWIQGRESVKKFDKGQDLTQNLADSIELVADAVWNNKPIENIFKQASVTDPRVSGKRGELNKALINYAFYTRRRGTKKDDFRDDGRYKKNVGNLMLRRVDEIRGRLQHLAETMGKYQPRKDIFGASGGKNVRRYRKPVTELKRLAKKAIKENDQILSDVKAHNRAVMEMKGDRKKLDDAIFAMAGRRKGKFKSARNRVNRALEAGKADEARQILTDTLGEIQGGSVQTQHSRQKPTISDTMIRERGEKEPTKKNFKDVLWVDLPSKDLEYRRVPPKGVTPEMREDFTNDAEGEAAWKEYSQGPIEWRVATPAAATRIARGTNWTAKQLRSWRIGTVSKTGRLYNVFRRPPAGGVTEFDRQGIREESERSSTVQQSRSRKEIVKSKSEKIDPKLIEKLSRTAQRIVGNQGTKLYVDDFFLDSPRSDAEFHPEGRGLIILSHTALGNNEGRAKGLLNHEVLHALKYLKVFTNQEWNVLKKAAQKNDWEGVFGIRDRYEHLYQWSRDKDGKWEKIPVEYPWGGGAIEESIAHAYEEWAAIRSASRVSGVRGLVKRIFTRISRFMRQLRSGLQKQPGIARSVEEVFKRIESGEVSRRTRKTPTEPPGPFDPIESRGGVWQFKDKVRQQKWDEAIAPLKQKKVPIKERIKAVYEAARDSFITPVKGLPNQKQWIRANEAIRHLKASYQYSLKQSQIYSNRVYDGLDSTQVENMSKLAMMLDAADDLRLGKENPFYSDTKELATDQKQLMAALRKSNSGKKVLRRFRLRQELLHQVGQKLVQIGAMSKKTLNSRQNYMSHQVREYYEQNDRFERAFDQIIKKKSVMSKARVFQREGTSKLYNVRLPEVDFQYTKKVYRMINEDAIKKQFGEYDRRSDIITAAKERNRSGLNQIVSREVRKIPRSKIRQLPGQERIGWRKKLRSVKTLEDAVALYRMKDLPKDIKGAMDALPTFGLLNQNRKNIGMGFSNLGKSLKGKVDQVPKEFRKLARGIIEATGAKDERTGDFLGWLSESAPESMSEATRNAGFLLRQFSMKGQIARDSLGDSWVSSQNMQQALEKLHDTHPEFSDLQVHQPDPGQVFYKAMTVPQKLADVTLSRVNELINAGPDTKGVLLKEDQNLLVQVAKSMRGTLIMGGPKHQMVLPQKLAKALGEFNDRQEQMWIWKAHKAGIRLWKQSKLILPWNIWKYSMRNISSDYEHVIQALGKDAVNPGEIKSSIKRIRDSFYTSKTPDREYMIAHKYGVLDNFLTSEVLAFSPDLSQWMSNVQRPGEIPSLPRRAGRRAQQVWNKYMMLNAAREQVLRLAHFSILRRKIVKMASGLDPTPENIDKVMNKIGYGGTNRTYLVNLGDWDHVAAYHSRANLGDYDNLSQIGQFLREYVIPFWSWPEVNTKIYYHYGRNTWDDMKTYMGLPMKSRLKVLGMAKQIQKRHSMRTLARLSVFPLMYYVANLAHPEEDEAMSDERRLKQQVILGQRGDFLWMAPNAGAINDFFRWVNYESAIPAIGKYLKGQADFGDIIREVIYGPINIGAQGLTPFFKFPAETISGKQWFPDVQRPRPIRDMTKHVQRSLSLDKPADWWYRLTNTGRPVPDWTQMAVATLVDTVPKNYPSYQRIRSLGYDFKTAHSGEFAWDATRSDKEMAWHYYKLALKYSSSLPKADRRQYLKRFEKNLIAHGVGPNERRGFARRAHPLGMLTKSQRSGFYKTLDDRDRRNLDRAVEYWRGTFLGGGK